jgi:hypothetical protein
MREVVQKYKVGVVEPIVRTIYLDKLLYMSKLSK